MTPPPKLLVVGGGSIGERHVRCFQSTGRVQVALCELNPQLRAAVSARYGNIENYERFDDACAAQPDLAVICTPAHLHLEMARALIARDIPVLIEKPLSVSLEGVDALLDLAAERRTTAGVAYVYRAHPVLTAMRQTLHSGRFGRIIQLSAVFGQCFPYYRPAYREIYYRDRATGGGAIQDALTHVLNAAEWLAGPITELVADAAHLALEGVSVEDTVHLLARHAGVLASYSLNQHQPANEGTLTAICERGMARFELHNHRWMWCERPEEEWHIEGGAPLQRDELFIRQANSFLDAVEGRAEPLCSLRDGAQTLKANLAALRSTESRRWESL